MENLDPGTVVAFGFDLIGLVYAESNSGGKCSNVLLRLNGVRRFEKNNPNLPITEILGKASEIIVEE